MSRIGRLPIDIPGKVKVEVQGRKVFVEGPKGKLDFNLPRRTSAAVEGAKINVSRDGDDASPFDAYDDVALHGVGDAVDERAAMNVYRRAVGGVGCCVDDVLSVAGPALRHRLVLGYRAEADSVAQIDLVREIVKEQRTRLGL